MARDLEVRHCRILVAVHDHEGVGAAARALGVAQSTVSEALLSLERLLGTPVTLRRAGRETVLTPAAIALLPHARTLVSISETALEAGLRHGVATIRIGTVESISSFLLPAPLSAFRSAWPQADVRIAIGLCEDIRRRVRHAELDAAISIERADRPHDPDVIEQYWPSHLRLVVTPGHPLAAGRVRAADLAARTCLLTDHDGAFNDLLKVWAGQDGTRPPRLESAGSVDGVKRGVLQSEAIGVLPDYAIADELAAGRLVALDLERPLPSLALCLTLRAPPPAGSPLDSLLETIRENLPVPATVPA